MTGIVLVRAPVGVVYRTLTDLDAWPCWLVGCSSRRLTVPPDADLTIAVDGAALVLPRPGRALRTRVWRIEVRAHGWRHDLGVHWDVRGDVELDAEWWLEECADGCLVHHVVHGVRSHEVRTTRHHQVMMHAMQAMKDHLELAVALASGRIP